MYFTTHTKKTPPQKNNKPPTPPNKHLVVFSEHQLHLGSWAHLAEPVGAGGELGDLCGRLLITGLVILRAQVAVTFGACCGRERHVEPAGCSEVATRAVG